MAQDYVLELDISVNNLMRMHIAHALQNLSGDNRSSLLRERLVPFKQLKQMSILSQFKQQIDVVLVTEEVVEFDQVGMLQE